MIPDTTHFRFTLEELEEADALMFGFCLACRAMCEACEPDAEQYICEDCGEAAVYGPHWIAIYDLVSETSR
ncbi:MAG: hypothetical protein AB7P07_07640 [Hyphomonadaceae bacterium]